MSTKFPPLAGSAFPTEDNIYGQYAIFVEGVAHLPGHLSIIKNYYLNLYK